MPALRSLKTEFLESNFVLSMLQTADLASSLRDERASVVRTPRTALRFSWAIIDTPSGRSISPVFMHRGRKHRWRTFTRNRFRPVFV